jgi:hypothetical protein
MKDFPEFRKMSGNVSKHVTLVSEMSEKIGDRDLLEISVLEQEMACYDDHKTHCRAGAAHKMRNKTYKPPLASAPSCPLSKVGRALLRGRYTPLRGGGCQPAFPAQPRVYQNGVQPPPSRWPGKKFDGAFLCTFIAQPSHRGRTGRASQPRFSSPSPASCA